MTAISDILRARIAQDGPITVADYMSECLLNPQHGYYVTQDPLGATGDFTTAPEISQMFGELLGLCLAQSWMDQGSPTQFILAELGPGRGTLMSDILRATTAVPGFHSAAEIHLIEASPYLRAKQAELLADYSPVWADTLKDLPDRPLFLVANEFFDALPIRQCLRDGPEWREVQIGVDAEGTLQKGLSPRGQFAQLAHRLSDTKDGDLVEWCPQMRGISETIGTHIQTHGGVGIIIDYGDWRSLGDTLQAVQNHSMQGPLDAPGLADLTAHVDFEALADASPCAHSRLVTQGVFLERLGITQRAQALAKHLSGQPLEDHITAHRRLTHPDEMGNLFKVLGFFPKGHTPPPGLFE